MKSFFYSSLNKLEKNELIASRVEKEFGSPKRKIYFIKESTKEFVQQEIKRMLHSPERVYSEFTIGMAFSYLLSKEEISEALEKYREGLLKRRQNIELRFAEQPIVQETPHLKALFTHPLKLIDAEIQWIDEFRLSLT